MNNFDFYLLLKAIHIIAVISWMAGLLYLPRLFVYHSEKAKRGSELDLTFQIMEKKLLKLIMNPAMIVTWICGLSLMHFGGFDFSSLWAWLKLLSVIAMTVFHMWLGVQRKNFIAGEGIKSGKTYRLANEVPTVLMIIIVSMVIIRPF